MAEPRGTATSAASEAARQTENRRARAVDHGFREPLRKRTDPTRAVADLLAGRDVAEPAAAPAPAESENDLAEVNGGRPWHGDDDAGSQDEPAESEEGSQDEPAEESGPGTLDDVARKLGLTKAELNSVEVAVGHERMTLGELKAKLPELAKLDKSREDHETARADWELQRIDSMRRIAAIVERFPQGSVPPAVLHAIEQDHQHNRAREAAMLTTARSDWADPVYAAKERQSMTELAKRYGFTPGEVSSLMDHRQVLLLQDFAALSAKFEQAKAGAKRETTPDVGAARGEGSAINAARPSMSRRDQMAQRVGALLRK